MNLNDAQQQAVSLPSGHALVLAGAGSGKTRVLVQRIIWLLEQGIAPFSILAVTFTNKAAKEMRTRVERTRGLPLDYSLWIGTFHGLCHRMLRQHYQDAKLPESCKLLGGERQNKIGEKKLDGHKIIV